MPGSTRDDVVYRLAGRLPAPGRGFDAVVSALKKGLAGTIDGAWGSSAALASAALAQVTPGPTLVVLAHPTDLDTWSDDLETFLGVRPVQVPDRDDPGPRLKVLKSLLSSLSSMEKVIPGVKGLLSPLPVLRERG